MKFIFADTSYWIALASLKDANHVKAKTVDQQLRAVRIVTSDEVLVEFLAYFSSHGFQWRLKAVELVRGILKNPNIDVRPQTRESFTIGLEHYERRPDKGYSLTDCISMCIMEKLKIKEVLTFDHHFTQEGFTSLPQEMPL
jgi:uncharacterized protein